MRIGNEDTNFWGGPGGILEILDCLALHFAGFHGGEREKESIE